MLIIPGISSNKTESMGQNAEITPLGIFLKSTYLCLESSAATPHTENEMLQSEENANVMGSCQNFCIHFNKVEKKKKKKSFPREPPAYQTHVTCYTFVSLTAISSNR